LGLILRDLSPNPIRRDQPAQRLVINRRNGCGPAVAAQRLKYAFVFGLIPFEYILLFFFSEYFSWIESLKEKGNYPEKEYIHKSMN